MAIFNKKPGSDTGKTESTVSDSSAPEPENAPPPLKPFAKPAESSSSAQARSSFHPDVPARTPDIPGLPQRKSSSGSEQQRSHDAANTLLVGSSIRLTGGEISNCERLVVEGRVEESNLSGAKRMEILSDGLFKGKATVEEAIISGHFDGELTVTSRLTVRDSGKITGSVRYGSITIEPGGEIRGNMQTLSGADDSAASTSSD